MLDRRGIAGRRKCRLLSGVPRSPTVVLALSLLAACDRAQQAPTPAPAPAVPAAPAAAPPTPTRPVAAAAAPRADARERARAGFDVAAARTQAGEFREHLAAGRKAVKAKAYADGIAAFEAALKIDPNHAAALAELGWAAYLAGDLAKAERFTRQAIGAASQERTRGAALYNLGRIHEDRGEKDEAATAYQRSVQLRPNDVVAARLQSLQSAGAVTEGHECDLRRHAGRPPFDLCPPVVPTLAGDPGYTRSECRESDTITTEVVVDAAGTPYGGEKATPIALDVGGGIQVAAFGVDHYLDSGGATTEDIVAILFDDRWYTTTLGSEYNPGFGYVGESLMIDSITAQDLVPGGRPELVIAFTWEHHDGDYGDNALESETEKIVGVLGLDGDAPRWLGAFVVSSVDEVGPMLDGEPTEATPSRKERKIDHKFAGGAVELSAVAGHDATGPVGRFELGALPAACPLALDYVM